MSLTSRTEFIDEIYVTCSRSFVNYRRQRRRPEKFDFQSNRRPHVYVRGTQLWGRILYCNISRIDIGAGTTESRSRDSGHRYQEGLCNGRCEGPSIQASPTSEILGLNNTFSPKAIQILTRATRGQSAKLSWSSAWCERSRLSNRRGQAHACLRGSHTFEIGLTSRDGHFVLTCTDVEYQIASFVVQWLCDP